MLATREEQCARSAPAQSGEGIVCFARHRHVVLIIGRDAPRLFTPDAARMVADGVERHSRELARRLRHAADDAALEDAIDPHVEDDLVEDEDEDADA